MPIVFNKAREAHDMAAHTKPIQLPRRFIKLAKVKDYTSLSTSEIYRRIAAGTFPAQVTLGPKSVAWIEAEILQWCDSLAAQRGEAA
ncbi:prophage CP4-57 regulatory protein [Pseudomonas sp. MT-1]|nr:prophage CP4-57 regulatory protein [Pseudomonas sp. MT-1]